MSEKVKVTQEQADAIESIKNVWKPHQSERDINAILIKEKLDKNYEWEDQKFIAANDIPTADFIAALHGYEVEPDYKEGDYVVYRHDGTVWTVTALRHLPNTVLFDLTNENQEMEAVHRGHLRHATEYEIAAEKERRWWARHGREIWELREGDVIEEGNPRKVCRVVDFEEPVVTFSAGGWDSLQNVKTFYKVVCFADQRLDRRGEDE